MGLSILYEEHVNILYYIFSSLSLTHNSYGLIVNCIYFVNKCIEKAASVWEKSTDF